MSTSETHTFLASGQTAFAFNDEVQLRLVQEVDGDWIWARVDDAAHAFRIKDPGLWFSRVPPDEKVVALITSGRDGEVEQVPCVSLWALDARINRSRSPAVRPARDWFKTVFWYQTIVLREQTYFRQGILLKLREQTKECVAYSMRVCHAMMIAQDPDALNLKPFQDLLERFLDDMRSRIDLKTFAGAAALEEGIELGRKAANECPARSIEEAQKTHLEHIHRCQPCLCSTRNGLNGIFTLRPGRDLNGKEYVVPYLKPIQL